MQKNWVSGIGALIAFAGCAAANPGGCSAAKSAGCESQTTASVMTVAHDVASEQGDIVDTAVAAGQFKTLAAALQAAGLVSALKGNGPFTVFAPTDEAFAKLPKGTVENLLKPENKALLVSILTYHVTSGSLNAGEVTSRFGAQSLNGQRIDFNVVDGKVMVDGAQVVKADVQASNGIIHAIDTVIMPSTTDIVGLAQNAGTFKTLLAAAQAAGLVDALKSDGPLTVFAPTDEAFAKLPKGTVENLLKPENRQALADVLKFHVVSGRVYARDAVVAERAPTLLGKTVTARVQDGRLQINNANVIKSDLEATNGVVHVIDTVLIPR